MWEVARHHFFRLRPRPALVEKKGRSPSAALGAPN
jgi:hypothetical protein